MCRLCRPVLWAVIEGRGRRPSHTFLDYALTYLLTSVVLAFTLGQVRHYNIYPTLVISHFREPKASDVSHMIKEV